MSLAVALTVCPDYAERHIRDALDRTLAVLELPVALGSAKVLLKPNLISAKHSRLACTEGTFILAAARCFIEHGAQVSIGDSPAFGTAEAVLKHLGLAAELAALNVRISNFRQGLTVQLPGGGRAVLAEDALTCDLLVNLPKVKAHAQTRVTLAVKNYFGCLVGLRKAWWHMAYGGSNGRFCDLIAQIPSALPPSISIIDGIVAMHKTGPVRGEAHPLSLVAAAANPVAADMALHEVLAVDPQHSSVMAACRKAGMAGSDLSQLSFPLASPQEVQAADFVVPADLYPVRFSLFNFLKSAVRRLLQN